jgi:hypothetical protein
MNKHKQAKVALNLRVPEDLKKRIDAKVEEMNRRSGTKFPVNRSQLAAALIEHALSQWKL